jgi:hypothetical protein
MLKKSLIALCIVGLAGCSAVSTYDSISDNVAYTYDQDLKQSVVKGPVDNVDYNSKASVEDFSYQLSVLNTDLVANIKVKYSGKELRQYERLIDSTGVSYELISYDKTIHDCGVVGSLRAGICNFSEEITVRLPREDRYNYVLAARSGDNIAFEIKKNYIAVMNDVIYKLRTPRADYDEQRIKKDTLIAAKPVEIKRPSLAQVPIQPPKPAAPLPAPIVTVAPVQEPLMFNQKVEVRNCTTKLVETCDSDKPVVKSVSQPAPKKVIVKKYVPAKQPVKKVAPATHKAVLTPTPAGNICAGMKFKNCSVITSCREAYDQLACGNRKVDPDKNGIPCQAICRTPVKSPAPSVLKK